MSKLIVPVGPEDHSQGDPAAEFTLVEYGDYECPHCGTAYAIVKRLQEHFGSRLLFVFRNFPLGQIHPDAEAAAETAEFAGAHGKFWEMHDLLFENQDQLGNELFQNLAEQLGLSSPDLSASLESAEYRKRVKADFSGGVRSGVNGTPTFFINGIRNNGPFDYEYLVNAIEASTR
jgi:protein-disulfide isomerase